MALDPAAYPEEVRTAIDSYLQRESSFMSLRPAPAALSGLDEMVFHARVSYERRLWSAARGGGDVSRAAFDYVEALRPCYEWEGFHDCPEHEALFADAYRSRHPGGPLDEYLSLLSAHRWLCAAEAFEFEGTPDSALRARERYQSSLAVARTASDVLVRTAAGELLQRGRCIGPQDIA